MINTKYFQDFPQLESERLIFRKQLPADAVEINILRSNDEVMTFMDQNIHKTRSDSEEFVTENASMYVKEAGMFWMVIEKESGRVIGDFAYWAIDKKNSRTEIGYSLKPEFWRKGFMQETLKTLLSFGFKKLNLHSFQADVNPNNEGSRNLLLKLGFKKEAYFKENYYYDGKFLDTEVYSLLKQDLVI